MGDRPPGIWERETGYFDMPVMTGFWNRLNLTPCDLNTTLTLIRGPRFLARTVPSLSKLCCPWGSIQFSSHEVSQAAHGTLLTHLQAVRKSPTCSGRVHSIPLAWSQNGSSEPPLGVTSALAGCIIRSRFSGHKTLTPLDSFQPRPTPGLRPSLVTIHGLL